MKQAPPMGNTATTDNYNRGAGSYETRWKDYLEHTHSYFLHHLSTDKDERILDPSCGTGLLAEEITETGFPFESMILNDPSDKMLKIARNRLVERPEISYTSFSIDSFPADDWQFSTILCLNAFHNYPDSKKAVRIFHKMLDPGGMLYILDWNREGIFRFINAFIRWYVPGTINTRSAVEMEKLIHSNHFDLLKLDTWKYRYWNFYFLKARKMNP